MHHYQATPTRGDIVDFYHHGEESNRPQVGIVLTHQYVGQLILWIIPLDGQPFRVGEVRHADDPRHTQGEEGDKAVAKRTGTWRFREVDIAAGIPERMWDEFESRNPPTPKPEKPRKEQYAGSQRQRDDIARRKAERQKESSGT